MILVFWVILVFWGNPGNPGNPPETAAGNSQAAADSRPGNPAAESRPGNPATESPPGNPPETAAGNSQAAADSRPGNQVAEGRPGNPVADSPLARSDRKCYLTRSRGGAPPFTKKICKGDNVY